MATQLLIVGHGQLAQALVDAAVLITQTPQTPGIIEALNFDVQSTAGQVSAALNDRLHQIGLDQQVLVLIDIFGASAMHACVPLLQKERFEVITGVNLAMVIYALEQYDRLPFAELCTNVEQRGQLSLQILSTYME